MHHCAKQRQDREGYSPFVYEAEVRFIEACGLRRAEVREVRVRDIHQDEEGQMWIHIAKRAGRAEREVPVLRGHERNILAFVHNARLFPDVLPKIDVQRARRQYACWLYAHLLKTTSDAPSCRQYHETAVREVMNALGHTQLSTVCRSYLRLQKGSFDQGTPPGRVSQETDQERSSEADA